MRLRSYNLGYQKGSPDLIIQNLHKSYSDLLLNSKVHKVMVTYQSIKCDVARVYKQRFFKVLLSNDYDKILKEIIHYLMI